MKPRILVAGIGNIFLGDDGFGVEVAKRLLALEWPENIRVEDFGIRGMDLTYALCEEWDAVIFLDIAARGEKPGTLSLIEHDNASEPDEVSLEAHGMEPLKVLALARTMGAPPTRTFVVACEPQRVLSGEADEELLGELSEPVAVAVGEAVTMVQELMVKFEAGGLS